MSDYNEQTLMEAVIKRVAGDARPASAADHDQSGQASARLCVRGTANLGGMDGRYFCRGCGWHASCHFEVRDSNRLPVLAARSELIRGASCRGSHSPLCGHGRIAAIPFTRSASAR